MTVYVHFTPDVGAGTRTVHNVAAVHDLGNSTITLVNMFADEPQTFTAVNRVIVEPARVEDDD